MADTQNSKWRSLRFWLPAFLSLLAIGGGLALYVFEVRIHKAQFEAEFSRNQTLLATRIQADVDRWVQRNDLDMVQSIFAELGVIPELKTAVFLDAANTVLASTRREDLGRPLDLERLGLAKLDPGQLLAALQTARQTMQGISLFTSDRNGVLACFPTSLPLQPGKLEVRRGGMVLMSYDLRLEKAASLRHLQTEFLTLFASILIIALTLGISLHFLITRRLARLKSAMVDFAAGKAVVASRSGAGDEISHLVTRFNEMAATIRKTMEEIQDLYDHAPCGYHSLDASGTFVRINDTELSWLGYTREAMVGKMKFLELVTAQSREIFLREFPGFKERGFVNDLDFEMVRKDGTILPVGLNATAIKDAHGNFVMSRSVVHDATERKRAENALRRLNRELRAISNCNQILMRAVDEQTLLNDICRSVCDEAGYRMTWVGYAGNDEAQTVRAVAWAGVEDGYLAKANITWADTEHGRGPTGTAIRSGKCVCIQNFTTDSEAAPWRENALQRGYRSSIALPLKDESAKTFGALTIYSTESNAFTPEEIRLMEELAGDLAFGVTVLRGRIERQQALEKIAHLAAIVKSSDDAIIGKTLNEQIVSWNRGAERIYGYTAGEIVGRSISLLVPPGLGEELATIMERLKRGETIEHLETTRVRRDGQTIHVALTISPIKDASGQIVGASTIARDITERKQTEAQIRRLVDLQSAILNNAAYMVISTDGQGVITTFNPAAERALGYTAEECVGKLTPSVFHDPGEVAERARNFSAELGITIEPGFEVIVAKARRNQPNESEWTYIRKDGRRSPVLLSVTALRDPQGNITGFLGMASDITERKAMEEELRLLNAELERRVRVRTRELAESEKRFRSIYDTAPVSIWQEDWTDVIAVVEDLRKQGVTDFAAHFREHPELVTRALNAVKILGVNHWTLGMFAARNKTELLASLGTIFATPDTLPGFVGELVALAQGQTIYRTEMALNTVKGDLIHTLLAMSFPPPGSGLGNVLVSVIDISQRKHAEEILAQERHRMNTLMDNIPDKIYFKDLQSRFVRVNRAMLAQLKVADAAHILGQTDFDFFTAEHAQQAFADEQRIIQTGEPLVGFEEKETWPDGSVTWVSTTKDCLRDHQGHIIGTFGISRNITEHKAAEETLRMSEERMRLFFERQLVGMAITSPEKGWVKVNDKICEMLGYSREELVRLTWTELTYPEDLASDVAQFERLLKGEIEGYTLEKRFVRKDGSLVFTNLAVGCVRRPDRSVDYVLALLEDITGRKRSDDQIRLLNEQLAVRAESLETANKELEAFSYSVSHDLRSPLRAIDGFSRIVLEDYANRLDAEGRNYLERIRAASQRMGHLIDDLLQLSRHTRSEMHRTQVDLSTLARALAEELQKTEPERRVEFVITPNLVANADASLLRVVLENLLGNAWKFTGKQAAPKIEFGRTTREGAPAYFVRDNGAGFDMTYAHKLFGAFQRLHTTDDFPGTGIGLATVQRIIHRHGGRLWAEAEINRGATFYFSLPPAT